MADDPAQRETMEQALASLVAFQRQPSPRLADLFTASTGLLADCLGIERASIWLRDDELLRCQDLYRRSVDAHSGGQVLKLGQHPRYDQACREETLIAVDDTRTDERTRTLVDDYLGPEGIGAMMDCPLFVGARHRGVLCAEHVGPPRAWRLDERLFMLAVGNLLSMALTDAGEREARRREQASEALYRSLVQDQTNFIIRSLPDGTIVFANESLLSFIGLQDLSNHRVFDFVPTADQDIVQRGVRRLTPEEPVVQYSHRTRTASGEYAMVDWRLRCVFDETGRPLRYQATGRDVTAERLQAEKLRESHRLEAMALLAGGVVHDLNNILTPIAAYADLALTTLPSGRPEIASMEKILAATARGHELARQVALFSRREREGIRKPIALDRFVRESLALLDSGAGARVQLVPEVEGHLVMVANPSDIYQILANLVGNAVSWIQGEGRVVVRARRLDEAHIELAVVDDGPGIPRDVVDRVFEPFFTTREALGGTGLGLTVVRGLVAELGGTIGVESAPGEGATFRMVFPAVADRPLPTFADDAPPKTSPHVLVVDDDRDIAEFLVMALQQLAYTVTSCTSAERALEVLEQHDVELLLTDLHMPGLDGLSLASRARDLHPELPVLLVSGYCDLLTDEELHDHGVCGMLAKPFTLRQLGDALEKALP